MNNNSISGNSDNANKEKEAPEQKNYVDEHRNLYMIRLMNMKYVVYFQRGIAWQI